MTATATKERPILFSGPMVRALLKGCKTQTRREVKFNHKPWIEPLPHVEYARDGMPIWWDSPPCDQIRQSDYYDNGKPCPYGKPGDRLWVREIHTIVADLNASHQDSTWPAVLTYKADGVKVEVQAMNEDWRESYAPPGSGYRSPIHMPRWASRIELEVTGVRVHRLQDISAKDIASEGVIERFHVDKFGTHAISVFDGCAYMDLLHLWSAGWDKINGKGSFESNPWVWAITFKVCSPHPAPSGERATSTSELPSTMGSDLEHGHNEP
jgi:hypothetical protein